jgi:hypothetical protein
MTRFIPFLMLLLAGPLAAQTAGPKTTQQLTDEVAAATRPRNSRQAAPPFLNAKRADAAPSAAARIAAVARACTNGLVRIGAARVNRGASPRAA